MFTKCVRFGLMLFVIGIILLVIIGNLADWGNEPGLGVGEKMEKSGDYWVVLISVTTRDKGVTVWPIIGGMSTAILLPPDKEEDMKDILASSSGMLTDKSAKITTIRPIEIAPYSFTGEKAWILFPSGKWESNKSVKFMYEVMQHKTKKWYLISVVYTKVDSETFQAIPGTIRQRCIGRKTVVNGICYPWYFEKSIDRLHKYLQEKMP